ncbi:hypothetical protein V6N13_144726 [Hibiscus sabdariffa]|uniref:Uncharacterized protein n=1 Tax=Hibiscus sabdariffa TaxID=183260 RepID=A0ABR2FLL6_9ROSI
MIRGTENSVDDDKEKVDTAVKKDYEEKLKEVEVEVVCNLVIRVVYQRSGGAPGVGRLKRMMICTIKVVKRAPILLTVQLLTKLLWIFDDHGNAEQEAKTVRVILVVICSIGRFHNIWILASKSNRKSFRLLSVDASKLKFKLLFLPSQRSSDLALVLDITDLNMPKERRDRSLSSDRCKRSPFSCHQSSPKFPYETEENLKEWEDARCPVCMEHPHNAILLVCSSHEKGCRPYMCDTSYRHSNCFDQFCKSFSDSSCTTLQDNQQEGTPLVTTDATATSESNVSELQEERTEEGPSTPSTVSCEKQVLSKLVCPLCRGEIKDCVVVEPARHFMNAKCRSCSSETCNFTGSYKDLRKHARLEHPSVRPSEADPERQRNWRRLERQRDLGDLLSTLQSSFGEERADDSIIPIDDGSWLTVFFLIRVFQPGSSPRSSSWSGTSRARAQLRIRRRSTRLWGESYDGETGSTRDEDNESSDSESFPRRRRVRRRTSPDNHP